MNLADRVSDFERAVRAAPLWAEDGEIRSNAPLTPAQIRFLHRYRDRVFAILTDPHGTRYLWRRRDPHNAAGWKVIHSERSPEELTTLLGGDVELMESRA